MQCDEVRARGAEMLSGDIEVGDREALEKHLEVCRECRAALDAMARVVTSLHAFEESDQERSARPVDVPAILAAARPTHARSGWGRRVAAFLLMVTLPLSVLALVGMRVHAENGVVTIQLGVLDNRSDPISGARDGTLASEPGVPAERLQSLVRELLRPELRSVAAWTLEQEQRHAHDLDLLVRWMRAVSDGLDFRHRQEAGRIEDDLAHTQAALERTQNALLTVAQHIPAPNRPTRPEGR